ncbi:MAG TPA: hypothetical protein VD996_12815, partial [Chitinophagaceae bacterium]|nr:hypothetical protein [Chitinophagaceae bacterium]
RLDKGLNVSTALPASPLFRLVTLTTNLPLRANEVYNVVVSGVSDCAGNTMGMMNAARAGLPRTPLEKDLVINEVLFNPRAGEPDFVELYNRSNNILDAAALQIASRNLSGVLSTPQRISETSFLIFPGDYLVISADKLRVPASVFVPAGFPSMPDDKGTVVVLSNQGIIIDELSYDERWHFPLVTAHEGVALERIDVNAPTQSRDNWTSAASDAGFATPGRLNSQSRTPNSFRENTTVSPRIFSPDNDGWDDHCFIHYRFASPGYVANISIFDAGGYLVRNLVQSATLSRQGFFRWDGLDNAGKPLPMGVYIILTEVFNLEGRTVKFKNPVTLARRF